MKAILKAAGRVIASLIQIFKSGKAQQAFDRALNLIPQALSIVEIIAKLTPTRSDDELLELFQRFGAPLIEKYLALPVMLRGDALKRVALTELSRQSPDTPESILSAAIEFAYLGYRSESKEGESV